MDKHESTTADFFDKWAKNGKGHSMAKGHDILIDGIFKTFSFVNMKILDVGCGVGKALAKAKNLSAKKLAGIDISDDMISIAKESLPEADLKVGSVLDLPWESNSFTHVISIEAMYYLQNPNEGIREIYRVLEENGKFSCAIDYYLESKSSHLWNDNLPINLTCWSENEWKSGFNSAGFKNVEISKIYRTDIKSEEEFQGSEYFPDYEFYLNYINAGALHISGTK